jgi:hypothetical protein
MLDEDLLQESNSGSEVQELNPHIQQRSQSMFLQNDSAVDSLLDYNAVDF